MAAFQALVARQDGDRITASVATLRPDDLPPGDVTVRVLYSSVNYKDALALTPGGGAVRDYPVAQWRPPALPAVRTCTPRPWCGWPADSKRPVGSGGMRAVQVTRLDGPDAVELTDIDEPSGDGVVVDVHAAGVAFPDALLTRGLYQYRPELPFVLGAEIAGVVRSAPEGAKVQEGDRVVGLTMLSGGMAEVAVLAPDRAFKLPDNVSFEAGAGLLFNDLTMYFALTVRGRLQRGETVLVHGAAGGIGTSALRLAPALGASRTIAVVSTQDKADIATAAGATDVVLADGFKDAVKELTHGRGVDIVVDPVGGDRFTDSLRSLTPGGRLLVVGFTGGEIPTVKVNRLLLNNVDVVGVGWGAWAGTHPGALDEQWAGLERLLTSGELAPPEPIAYPLEQAATAVASLENRSAKGKVVLRVRD